MSEVDNNHVARPVAAGAPILDHVVINVRFGMDQAEKQFATLGFGLTPRGFHSLGSINHLMIFASDYLELLGLPQGAEDRRPELVQSPLGLNGLVFKSDDVDSTYEHLKALGMDGDRPRSFSRPVEVDGKELQAAFRTVTVRPGVFPSGRVYFCEHQTPELVWHTAWQSHPNCCVRTKSFVVVAPNPEEEAARYASLIGGTVVPSERNEARGEAAQEMAIDLQGSEILVQSPGAYRRRFGVLSCEVPDGSSIFGAVSFGVDSLDQVRASLHQSDGAFAVRDEPSRVVVRVNQLNTLLEFAI